jgi:hypothetical protein
MPDSHKLHHSWAARGSQVACNIPDIKSMQNINEMLEMAE